MKSFKIFAILFAMVTLPFLSKAQRGGGGGIIGNLYMTVTYIEGAYGDLTCVAAGDLNTYTQTILGNSGLSFGGPNTSYTSLTISVNGEYVQQVAVSDLEAQPIGVASWWYYVPKSPSGTAPIYSIVRNGQYDYTIRTWQTPI